MLKHERQHLKRAARLFVGVHALACLLFCLLTPSALACRYSVRDVGFVDLTNESYRLLLFHDSSLNQEAIARCEQIAEAVYLDANVQFQTMPLDGELGPEHRRYFERELQDESPAAVFVAPDGRFQSNLLDETPKTEAAIWSFLESYIQSPATRRIQERILDAYCLVLLVEGTDEKLNAAARESIESAIESIKPKLPLMPKPVDHPPEIVVIRTGGLAREKHLLWSLGFDLNHTVEPQAAVLHGRGRRIGEVCRGGLITQTKLQEIMAVVGLDCECGLDRSWMQGPLIPMAWTETLRNKAYQALGFDADNPMVRTEISQILQRGPNARPGGEIAPPSVEGLLLGYSEEWVEEPAVEVEGLEISDEPNRDDAEPVDDRGDESTLIQAPDAVEPATAQESNPETADPEGVAVTPKQPAGPAEVSLESLIEKRTGERAEENASAPAEEEQSANRPTGAILTFFLLILASVGGGGWVLFRSIRNT